MLMVESYCHSVEGQWSEERAHGYLISLHFFNGSVMMEWGQRSMYGVRQGIAVTYVNNIVIAWLKRAREAHPTIARTAGDLHQDNCTRHRNCGNLCCLIRPTSIPAIHFPSWGVLKGSSLTKIQHVTKQLSIENEKRHHWAFLGTSWVNSNCWLLESLVCPSSNRFRVGPLLY